MRFSSDVPFSQERGDKDILSDEEFKDSLPEQLNPGESSFEQDTNEELFSNPEQR